MFGLRVRKAMVLFASLALWASATQAGEVLPDVPTLEPARAEVPPQIDGDLSDACWQDAAAASGFLVYNRLEKAQAQTRALLAYDQDAVYVAFRCEEPDPDRLVARARRRDGPEHPVHQDDCVELFLAPGTGGAWYYHLVVNSAGVIKDQLSRLRPEMQNNAWDGQVDVAAAVDEAEWRVEMAIPWYNFGEHLGTDEWLVQFCRGKRTEPTELTSWSYANGSFHNVDRFGRMDTPEVDLERYQGLTLYAVRISEYGVAEDGYTYRVQGEIGNDRAQPREVTLRFTDRPLSGESATVSVTRTLEPNEPTAFEAELPVSALGPRTLALEVQEAATGAPVLVTAFAQDQFPEVGQVFLDRHYYTSEPNARAVAVTSLPPGAEGLELTAEVEGLGTFTAPVADPRRTAVDIPLADVENGAYPARLRIEDARGDALAQAETTLVKHPPAPEHIREVKVDRDRLIILKDGEPFFPICIYNIPPEYLDECAQAGFNMTLRWGGQRNFPNMSRDEQHAAVREYLDEIHDAGMFAMEYPTGFHHLRYSDPQFEEKARTFINDILPPILEVSSQHPAVLAYYVLDEPSEPHKEICREFIAKIREYDPYHPAYILYSTGVRHWPDVYDFAGRDYYYRHYAPLITVYQTAKKEVARATRARVAYWHVPLCEMESSRVRGESTPVTGLEQRAQTYMAVIGGVKGMLWWVWPPRRADNWAMLKQMAGELRTLSPALLEVAPEQDVQWSPRESAQIVVALAKVHDGQTYLISANGIESPVEATLRLPEGLPAEAEVLFEGRQVRFEDGALTERYEGYGRHVYRFQGAWPAGETLRIENTRSVQAPAEAAAPAPAEEEKQVNLVQDGGFESEENWRFEPPAAQGEAAGGRLEEDEDNPRRKYAVLRLGGEVGRVTGSGWPVRLKPNTQYLFGVRARVEGAGNTVGTAQLDGGHRWGDYVEGLTLLRMSNETPELEPYIASFTTRDRPIVVRPMVRLDGPDGIAWFNDMYLYEVGEQSRNLIANSGFEQTPFFHDEPPGWVLGSNVPGTIGGPDALLRHEDEDVYEGERAFYVAGGQRITANIRGPFTPGEPITLSLYAKGSGPDATLRVQMGWSTHMLTQITEIQLSNEWERYEINTEVESPLETTFIYLTCETGEWMLLDAVQYEKNPQATEYVPGR